jgi:hypothetical protein
LFALTVTGEEQLMAKTPERDEQTRDRYQIEFVGLKPGDEAPTIVVQALDQKSQVIHSSQVGKDGVFTLPDDILKKSHRVVVGAPTSEGGVAKGALRYRAEEFAATIRGGTLALAESVWGKLRFYWTCVSGRVRLCRRRPWWYDNIFVAASAPLKQLAIASPNIAKASPSLGDLIAWPYRCYTVCLGTVEVYRRTCCCHPIVVDWRIPDLIRDLEVIVEKLPKFPPPRDGFPPPPPPPPVDPFKTPVFKGGALNELALNASHDLVALRSLPAEQAVAYINQRAYLSKWFCSCSRPSKVAEGTINPDGTFNICWRDFPRILSPNCHVEYAYVVKQTIGGVTTTIYDGVAAGIWFHAGDDALLTSYNPNAFTCGETGTPTGDAIVYLDLIGDTESHELITPDATGWDRVAMPASNSGLLFPNVGPNSSHERNLGGSLKLKFFFSLAMRDAAIGAMYYRVSVTRADTSGNPTGPRRYFDEGLAWKKVVGLNVEPESLGPVTVGGEGNLYRIPYVDEPWTGDVEHHALINTLKTELNVPDGADLMSPSERHLITLEVFNAAGERLRPLGTPATGQPGTEVAKAFKFMRWFQPSGSPGDDLTPVPFGALTHMFLWDNRPPVADITRLVRNGLPSAEECQFLVGSNNATFAIEYRSYVADPRCLFDQSIGWVRGLNGSSANGGAGSLDTPAPPVNVGKPPAIPGISGSNTFELMLTRLQPPFAPAVLQRCSFAVTLTTWSKTTDGESLAYPHSSETAAFALQITAP